MVTSSIAHRVLLQKVSIPAKWQVPTPRTSQLFVFRRSEKVLRKSSKAAQKSSFSQKCLIENPSHFASEIFDLQKSLTLRDKMKMPQILTEMFNFFETCHFLNQNTCKSPMVRTIDIFFENPLFDFRRKISSVIKIFFEMQNRVDFSSRSRDFFENGNPNEHFRELFLKSRTRANVFARSGTTPRY